MKINWIPTKRYLQAEKNYMQGLISLAARDLICYDELYEESRISRNTLKEEEKRRQEAEHSNKGE